MKSNLSESEKKIKKATEVLWKIFWFNFYLIIIPFTISLIIYFIFLLIIKIFIIALGSFIGFLLIFINPIFWTISIEITFLIFGAILLVYIHHKEKNEDISVKWRFYTTIFFIILLIITLITIIWMIIQLLGY